MTPEEALAHPPRILTQAQREAYYEEGYLHLEGFIDEDWMAELVRAMDELIDRSRRLSETDDVFVLADEHRADSPRLRRINYAADNHPSIWKFAKQSILPDVVADLVGPNVKFREAMINFKWAQGGDEVKWHQDTSYPYTNPYPLQILTSLCEIKSDMGPLEVVPGSHRGEVFDRYDEDNRWVGSIKDDDLARVPLDKAVTLTGPPGSITVLYMHVVHGSRRNDSDRSRPLLACGYDPADAFPLRRVPMVSRYTGEIVRGAPVRHAHLEAGQVLLPPDWSQEGYTSIYEIQHEQGRKQRQ